MIYKFPDGFHPQQYSHKKIGILGGSFNPAHKGHLELSIKAKQFFNFDEIWWMINPQNPLKPKNITKPFEERFQYCKDLTQAFPFIKPCPIEFYNQTNMTYQLVNFLKTYYSQTQFIWLMGSDLVCQMHQWEFYQSLTQTFPMIIYYRRAHFQHIRQSPLLTSLKKHYISSEAARTEIFFNAPRWTIFPFFHNDTSSTKIRNIWYNESIDKKGY